MADKKTTKHSGFEGPTYGTVVPDGYRVVVGKDGVGKIVKNPAKKSTKKTTKKK